MQITDHLPLAGSSLNNHFVAISAGPFPALKAGNWFHHLGFCITEPANCFYHPTVLPGAGEQAEEKRKEVSPIFAHSAAPSSGFCGCIPVFFCVPQQKFPVNMHCVTCPSREQWQLQSRRNGTGLFCSFLFQQNNNIPVPYAVTAFSFEK